MSTKKIQKTIFVYCDSAGHDYYVFKAATGNINLDANAGTEEDIEFEIVVDSSADKTSDGEDITWGWADDAPTYGEDEVSGNGFLAVRSPDNTSTTPVSTIFPEISINSNKLKIKDANPSGVSGNDSLYGFTVTVVGTYGDGQSMRITTDPTIRNRTGGIG